MNLVFQKVPRVCRSCQDRYSRRCDKGEDDVVQVWSDGCTDGVDFWKWVGRDSGVSYKSIFQALPNSNGLKTAWPTPSNPSPPISRKKTSVELSLKLTASGQKWPRWNSQKCQLAPHRTSRSDSVSATTMIHGHSMEKVGFWRTQRCQNLECSILMMMRIGLIRMRQRSRAMKLRICWQWRFTKEGIL